MTHSPVLAKARLCALAFILAATFGHTAQAGNWRIGLSASNLHQEASLTFSRQVAVSHGYFNYSIFAELHPFDNYDAAGFQFGYGSEVPVGENYTLAVSLPFAYDNHYEVNLEHYSFAPRLTFTRSAQSGAFLRTFVELSVDGGNINEQVSRTQRLGLSFGLPLKQWNIEASTSVGRIRFPSAPSHNMFLASVSLSRELGDNWAINLSADAARDLAKVRTEGRVFRSVTDSRSFTVSLSRRFGNHQVTSFISASESRSANFDIRQSEAGIRFSFAF